MSKDDFSKYKISFNTLERGSKKSGLITADIFDNKAMIKFDNADQMRFTLNSLLKSGKKAFYSRGLIIQLFTGIKKEAILEIFREDIKSGVAGAGKLKKDIVIENYKEEKIR